MDKVIEIGKEKHMRAWPNLTTHRHFRSNLQPGDIFQIREEIHIWQGHWGRKDKRGTVGCMQINSSLGNLKETLEDHIWIDFYIILYFYLNITLVTYNTVLLEFHNVL